MIYLDTHLVAWLYQGEVQRIPGEARAVLESEELLISPMVGLELQLLNERGRFKAPVTEVLQALSTEIGLTVCDLAFPLVAARAREASWTRDPFDRLIVAQAQVRGAPLLTRDRHIRAHYARAIWDTAPSSI
jgi:PIN domain nuclease of toxin-antitoxin system